MRTKAGRYRSHQRMQWMHIRKNIDAAWIENDNHFRRHIVRGINQTNKRIKYSVRAALSRNSLWFCFSYIYFMELNGCFFIKHAISVERASNLFFASIFYRFILNAMTTTTTVCTFVAAQNENAYRQRRRWWQALNMISLVFRANVQFLLRHRDWTNGRTCVTILLPHWANKYSSSIWILDSRIAVTFILQFHSVFWIFWWLNASRHVLCASAKLQNKIQQSHRRAWALSSALIAVWITASYRRFCHSRFIPHYGKCEKKLMNRSRAICDP